MNRHQPASENDVRGRSEGTCQTNQEAGRKHQVPMDGPMGTILPSSAKLIGSPQYL